MLIVAGLSLKNLRPRVWDPASPYYLPCLRAVMVSYADVAARPGRGRGAMERGLHAFLGVPRTIRIYLDNGAFHALKSDRAVDWEDYAEFVAVAEPDWWPVPEDSIPLPSMTPDQQTACLRRTMLVNRAFDRDGSVPVIHVGRLLSQYITEIGLSDRLRAKSCLALGGIVPNLLRAPKAPPYAEILDDPRRVREAFADKQLHLFGIRGTATLHLAALLGIDSVDSSGWRNRAARGIVQLPGSGDRMVANLGSWRGREPSVDEWKVLARCGCPACRLTGMSGLTARGMEGFCNRAAHNLWVLIEESRAIETRLTGGSYAAWYENYLDNSIYLPLVRRLVADGGRGARATPRLAIASDAAAG